jgi:lysophospholipase L1-like esterase
MTRRLLVTLIAVLALPACASAHKVTHYYIALGDSLSQGMQPDQNGVTRNTSEGYVDDLYRFERRHVRDLRLVKFGCGGDTTESLLTGKGNEKNAKLLHCNRKGGSQLKAAERFLRHHHHRGEISLVTIDIGANDVDNCATAPNIGQCVVDGENALKNNLPLILDGLKRVAPRRTTLAGMTLYDPVLAGYFSSNPNTRGLAAASVAFLHQINNILAGDDQQAGFRTADVAGAFDSYDQSSTVAWEGRMIPVNVARVCAWTWACATPPVGPNIHANKNGYAVISQAFAAALPRLR